VAPLDRRNAQDAFQVVAALHALAATLGVARVSSAELDAMAAANERFSAASRAATSTRPWPRRRLPRRPRAGLGQRRDRALARAADAAPAALERLRFGSLVGRRSVEQHAAIVERCAPAMRRRRRGRARELALARNPHRSELHVTDTVASPAAGLEAYERFRCCTGPRRASARAAHRHLGGPRSGPSARTSTPGVGMGGNKLRKLEYLVADALAQGCDTLVSIGGVQSNHTRSVAAGGRPVAGPARAARQESWVDWPDAVYDRVGNILLSRIMGAEVELVRSEFDIGVKESWQRAIDEVRDAGGRPYPIPAGASDHPLGGLGFASFAREVERQETELGVFFDHVDRVHGDRAARRPGMIAGFAAGERPRRVLGIDASARIEETRDAVARIARDTAARIGLGRDAARRRDRGPRGLRGERYGVPVAQTLDAIRLAGRLEGMVCDPVYEGKSMAGLSAWSATGRFPRTRRCSTCTSAGRRR
jgi:1-aminocyclopropane-1-carboxylate deaminase